MSEIGCTCPSGDGSLRWPCPQHPPAEIPPTEIEQLAAAIDELHTKLFEAIAPAALALIEVMAGVADALRDMGEALREDWRESIPGRFLNRRARRAAMRRHPAGRVAIVELPLQLPDVGQPDAGAIPTPAELAARAGIRLPNIEQLQRQLDADMAQLRAETLAKLQQHAGEIELQLSTAEIRDYQLRWHYGPLLVRRPSPFVRLPHDMA